MRSLLSFYPAATRDLLLFVNNHGLEQIRPRETIHFSRCCPVTWLRRFRSKANITQNIVVNVEIKIQSYRNVKLVLKKLERKVNYWPKI